MTRKTPPTVVDIATLHEYARRGHEMFRTPRQLGSLEVAGMTAEMIRTLPDNPTRDEVIRAAAAVVASERPGWDVRFAWEPHGKDAGSVRFQVGTDATIYQLPHCYAVKVREPLPAC